MALITYMLNEPTGVIPESAKGDDLLRAIDHKMFMLYKLRLSVESKIPSGIHCNNVIPFPSDRTQL
jgi:hypothetical protein